MTPSRSNSLRSDDREVNTWPICVTIFIAPINFIVPPRIIFYPDRPRSDHAVVIWEEREGGFNSLATPERSADGFFEPADYGVGAGSAPPGAGGGGGRGTQAGTTSSWWWISEGTH